MSESKRRARYTLEYKLEAVRLVKGGQVAAVTAKILGIPKQTLENWVRLHGKGQLKGTGDKPDSASATRPCWPTSGPSTPRSSKNTAGPRCARNWWHAASAWARSACAGR